MMTPPNRVEVGRTWRGRIKPIDRVGFYGFAGLETNTKRAKSKSNTLLDALFIGVTDSIRVKEAILKLANASRITVGYWIDFFDL
jgi:hypothetical protein